MGFEMKREGSWKMHVLMLVVLMSALTGCSEKSIVYEPPVAPPAMPSLPSEARQPTVPSTCSPTCSAKWSEKVELWRQRLTGVE